MNRSKRRSRPVLSTLALLASTLAIPSMGASSLEMEAKSPSLSVQSHGLFSNSREDDQIRNLVRHENVFLSQFSNFRASATTSNYLPLEGTDSDRKWILLEKKILVFENSAWTLQLGDSTQELGRGLALSLHRLDVFGIHNTLEGASAQWHPKGLKLVVFGGRVNALRNPVALQPAPSLLENRTVWLAGTSLQGKITSDVTVGGHYFYSANQPNGRTIDRQLHTVGLTTGHQALFGGIDAYAESNIAFGVSRILNLERSLPTAYGTYASLDWVGNPWRARWEIKDYRNYTFEFRRPPTLEEDIVESTNTQDVTASRFQVEHALSEETSVLGSLLVGSDRQYEAPVYHGVIGAKTAFTRNELELRGGYRWMPDKNRLAHVMVRAKFPTAKQQAFELSLRKQVSETKLDSLPAYQDKYITLATYSLSPRLNFSIGYEFVPSNDVSRQHFGNVAGAYQTADFTARALVGQTSGGTICSGGVCRQVPAYTGAMVETSVTF